MPSPIGHLIGGVIVSQAMAPSALLFCTVAGVAPDLDFLWGRHNQETHSVGMAIFAGVVVYAWKRNVRLASAVTVAWLSHVLFDWLGSDTTPPLGVMALWPLNSNFYFADAYVFEAISRRYWLDNFYTHNAWAVAREVLILGPIAWMAWGFRRRWEKIKNAAADNRGVL